MHSTGAVATINCSSDSPTNNNYTEYGWCGPSPDDNYPDHFIPNETLGHGGQVVHPYYDYHHSHHHHQHYVNNNGSEEDCCSGPEYGYGSRSPPGSGSSYVWECPSGQNQHASSGPLTSPSLLNNNNNGGLNPRPTVKRRSTANKKERRRTQSINNAFAELRDCIPNVPADTKLSKIKTLRLATSYIAYLSDTLTGDDPSRTPAAFQAEISRKLARGDDKRKKELLIAELSNSIGGGGGHGHHHERHDRKTKGRTGWPQAVWSGTLELQQ